MSDEQVTATYAGIAAVYIPRLGVVVGPGDTLSIPASMADEMSDVWSVAPPAKAKGAPSPAPADDEQE